MHKFTTSSHSLDLEGKQVTTVNENRWFTDQFFARWSFNIDLAITPELESMLGNLTDHNAVTVLPEVAGYYYYLGEEHEALLIVERVTSVASVQIVYGLEELPNFSKQLPALALDKMDLVGTSIRAHAQSILNDSFPAVTHNFPQIHINSLDIGTEQWQYFVGRLNARDAGIFLINEYDAVADEQINSTIMQPLPALLHVVKAGFEDAGYTVTGSFFNDSAFAKAYIFYFSEYYRSFTGDSQTLVSNRTEHDGTIYMNPFSGLPTTSYNFRVATTPLAPGRYIVAGTITSRGFLHNYEIKVGNVRVASGFESSGLLAGSHYVDIVIDIFATGANDVVVTAAQSLYDLDFEGNRDYNAVWCDLSITQIAKYDASGNLVSTLIDANNINLSKCVPDISFGQLMTTLKTAVGLDIVPLGNRAFELNFVKDVIDRGDVIDLSSYEVRFPQRDVRSTTSYKLSFPVVDNEDFIEKPVLVDSSGVQPFTVNPASGDLTEVPVDFIPLPLKTILSRPTATQVGDDASALYICRYDGLQNGENFCITTGLSLLTLVESYTLNLYDLQIKGQRYEWSFVCEEHIVKQIKTRSRVFAYNRIFNVLKVENTDLGRGYFQVRLELIGTNS